MSQRLIKVPNNGVYSLSELVDTNLSNISPYDTLIYNDGYWQNINLTELSSYLHKVKLHTDTFIAENLTTHIVSVNRNGIICYLPSNPNIGDYIEIIDKYAALGTTGCSTYGFSTYNLKVEAALNYYIETDREYYLTKDGEYLKLVYIGCQTWRIVKAGITSSSGGDSITGDYVRSINDFTGVVSLNASHIPETTSRQYYNYQRFLTSAGSSSLDIFNDVDYDQYINDKNVLTWDASAGKWVPRSILLNIGLNGLIDVNVSYHETLGHPVSRGYSTTQVSPLEAYNTLIYTPDQQVFNPETGQMETVNGVSTGLTRYRRDWILGWQDSDLTWRILNRSTVDQRRLLADLQDVEINIVDGISKCYLDISHGQVLQWDSTIHRWVPGDVAAFTSSDDLPEGDSNFYLTVPTLRALSKSNYDSYPGLTLGHLGQVDSALINMNNNLYPTSKVLGWVPIRQRWEAVEALTSEANTADIDEGTFIGNDPPWDKSTTDRGYFTGKRVQTTLQNWGLLSWFLDVDYPFGRAHGNSLVWDATRNKWIASTTTSAISTDYLPQGSSNLYYTDSKVSNWAYYNLKPSINYFNDIAVTNPQSGQILIWDSTLSTWKNGFPSPFPLYQGELLVGSSNNNPYDLTSLHPGVQGQYLRVDYSVPGYLAWQDLATDDLLKATLVYPDIPQNKFTRARDLTDTILFLGTANGSLDKSSFINPQSLNLLSFYFESQGAAILSYTDRKFYNNTPSASPGVINDNTIVYRTITESLIIAFPTNNAYRLEQVVIQAKVLGTQFFKVYTSPDATNWTPVRAAGSTQDFEFELSEDMYSRSNIGLNSEIIESDEAYNSFDFFLVTLPYLEEGLSQVGSDNFLSLFTRYIKFEPQNPTNLGIVQVQEISLYGWVNNGFNKHTLINKDHGLTLTTAVNNLQIELPGTDEQILDTELKEGFTCWITTSDQHTCQLFTNSIGIVYGNFSNDNSPSLANPYLIPPNSILQVFYLGKVQIEGLGLRHRWQVLNLTGGVGGGSGVDITDPNYYLNRVNHFGTQSASTITGLANIATSGSWVDILNKPTFFDGNYNNLTNKPTLGTAASQNIGTAPSNVVQLTSEGKLPAIDGSLLLNVGGAFNSPATTKGDLIVHNGVEEVRFPLPSETVVGELDGLVLLKDSSSSTGLSWGQVSAAGTDAQTLQGQPPSYYLDLGNSIGSINVAVEGQTFITGLHKVAITGKYSDLEASSRPVLGSAAQANIGLSTGNVVSLIGPELLPALDGSNLYNINSPLQNLGDLIVRANEGIDAALPIGASGQILTVDNNSPVGIAWKDPAAFANATTLDNQPSSYYLDIANLTGTFDVSSPTENRIIGLGSVAITNSYTDLDNLPSLFDGDFNSLSNIPNICNLFVGTSPFNIVQLTATGKLPAGIIDTDLNFISPLTSKGQLMVRGAALDEALDVGTNNQLLLADSAAPLGVRWANISELSVSPSLPLSQKGDLLVYDSNINGLAPISVPPGVDGAILITDTSVSKGIKWGTTIPEATKLVGVDTVGVNKYYGTDSTGTPGFHPYSTGVGSPLSSKGDLYVYDSVLGNARLPLGTNNQILTVNDSLDNGLEWVNISTFTINATTFNNQLPTYFLDRANHSGTQLLSTISDAGTSASRDAGTLAGEVLLITEDNKLPSLDGSLLTGVASSILVSTVNSNTSLSAGKVRLILLDSSMSSFTVNLPVNPTDNDKLIFTDFAGSNANTPTGLGLNSVILLPTAGHTIQGYTSLTLDDENTSVSLIFSNNKWTIYSATF